MKKTALMIALFTIIPIGHAEDAPERALDTINFQVSARQWVSTKTAKLIINLNATLKNTDLVKARNEIMAQLAKIANSQWHIIEFERSQDNSGLEKLFVKAQARVTQEALPKVYQTAKTISTPGMTYEVGSIEFKPSFEEVEQLKTALREQVYQQANQEISRINAVYTQQHYTLNQLVFMDVDGAPQFKKYRALEKMNAMPMAASSANLNVSNALVLTAVVQAASSRKEEK